VFSIVGTLRVRNRNRLTPKTIGVILFLRSWGCLPNEFTLLDKGKKDDIREPDLRKEFKEAEEEAEASQDFDFRT